MGALMDDKMWEHKPFIEQELNNFFKNKDENIQLAREKEDDQFEGPTLLSNFMDDDIQE